MAASDNPKGMSLADRIEAMTHALKIKDLADMLHCSPTNLYNMAREGRMGSGVVIRLGGTIRLDPHGTAEWLRRQGLNRDE
jgi:hypothetical protein